jgi:hypothetical protein
VNGQPGLGQTLVDLFAEARRLADRYLSEEDRLIVEDERRMFGPYDPYSYCFSDTERKSLEALIAALERQNLLVRKVSLDEVFPTMGL